MNRFLKYIAALIAPIVLVWLSVEVFYRKVPNNYTFKNSLIQDYSQSVKTIIFGDSHTFYGLNPEFFSQKTINMANVSQTIYFDKLIFEKYADELPNLKYIIIPVEYTTLSQADNTQEDYWRKYFYDAQMNLDVPLIEWYDPKKYSLALTRKLGKTGEAVKFFLEDKTLVGCDSSGWGNTYLSKVDSIEIDYLAKVISRKHDDGSMDFSHNIKRLERIITTCKEKQIQVILVNMPVSQPYLKLLNQKEVSEIIKQSEHLSQTNKNVTHVNLLYDNRFELADFHDADHLNINGAKTCSKIINAIIEKL